MAISKETQQAKGSKTGSSDYAVDGVFGPSKLIKITEDKTMATKKSPKSRKKGLKKVALKPIKTLKPLYTDFGNIKGDTTSAGHEGWIEVNS